MHGFTGGDTIAGSGVARMWRGRNYCKRENSLW